MLRVEHEILIRWERISVKVFYFVMIPRGFPEDKKRNLVAKPGKQYK